jgi:hypothetical protein
MKVHKCKHKNKTDCFTLHKRIVLKDMPYFEDVSMRYFFKNPTEPGVFDTIFFAKKEEIFQLNFETEECTMIY